MSNEMSREELISELYRIAVSHGKYEELKQSILKIKEEAESHKGAVPLLSNVGMRDFRKEQEKKLTAKKPRFAEAFMRVPPARKSGKIESDNLEKDIRIGVILALAMEFSLAFLVVSAFFFMEAAMLAVVPVIGLAWAWATKTNLIESVQENRKKNEETNQERVEWESAISSTAVVKELDRVISVFREYDSQFLELVKACREKRKEQQDVTAQMLQATDKETEEKMKQIEKEKDSLMREMDEKELLSWNLYGEAGRIASILEDGRANTLQEAINLALDEARKDEEERNRQEEARRQEEILEQQAEDNRRHNAAMQRAAEEQAMAMRDQAQAAQQQARAAEEQAREAKRQRERAEQQAWDASSRCTFCANIGKCNPAAMKNAQNCAAYRPR